MAAMPALPLPRALLPITEYMVGAVGETAPVAIEFPNPVPLHVYEVAAGVHLAVKVEEPPAETTAGEAFSVHTGVPAIGTTTVTDPAGPTPCDVTPATVYIDVAKGVTVQLEPVLTAHEDPVQT